MMKSRLALFIFLLTCYASIFATITPQQTALLTLYLPAHSKVLKQIPVGQWQAIIYQAAGQMPSLMYIDKQGQYAFFGYLLDNKGHNVSEQLINQYVHPLVEQQLWQHIATDTQWFVEGDQHAPHTIYVVADPNSDIVKKYYLETLYPAIVAKQLAVRWILVGAINQDSEAKANAFMQNINPAQAWHDYLTNTPETGFNVKLDTTTNTPEALSKNVQFMLQYRLQLTPVTIFKTTDKQLHIVSGFIQDEILIDNFLAKILLLC